MFYCVRDDWVWDKEIDVRIVSVGCPSVWDVTLRSRSGNHLHHLRAISKKFDFLTFFRVFVKVFSRFSFRFVEITADDCLIIEDD